MTTSTKTAPLVAGLLALTLAACGSSSSAASTSATTAAAHPRAQITKNWTSFFDSKTSAAQRARLLQNGGKFSSVIKSQSGKGLASETTAKVKSVTLSGSDKATVLYTILLNGQPALKNQKGVALLHDGIWQVSDSSFCGLLGLQGTKPPACSAG